MWPACLSDYTMTLSQIIAARLGQMGGVAQYKWNHGLPVTDPDRETAVIERTVAAAKAIGLEEAYATQVVAAQMRAAKLIQNALFEEWRAAEQGAFAQVPDLNAELRPAIGKLTRELLETLVTLAPSLARCQLPAGLRSTPPSLHHFGDAWHVAVFGLLPYHCTGQRTSSTGNQP
jgi:chorismate mutase-like protein